MISVWFQDIVFFCDFVRNERSNDKIKLICTKTKNFFFSKTIKRIPYTNQYLLFYTKYQSFLHDKHFKCILIQSVFTSIK